MMRDPLAAVSALSRELYALADRRDDPELRAVCLRLSAALTGARKELGLSGLYPIELAREEGSA